MVRDGDAACISVRSVQDGHLNSGDSTSQCSVILHGIAQCQGGC
jgi:hypothetical protein